MSVSRLYNVNVKVTKFRGSSYLKISRNPRNYQNDFDLRVRCGRCEQITEHVVTAELHPPHLKNRDFECLECKQKGVIMIVDVHFAEDITETGVWVNVMKIKVEGDITLESYVGLDKAAWVCDIERKDWPGDFVLSREFYLNEGKYVEHENRYAGEGEYEVYGTEENVYKSGDWWNEDEHVRPSLIVIGQVELVD